ncbi:hypothetical protein RchiOBHm_Chr4g0415311 [Rosa chinensis]|uniref:RNase H type-1 domain-containing protein n=1 Tax=Rosa chinensis TaxID=74649 RepID=A0A2P6QWI4_ROSCH|nr:hypothetical protein RchiOBHm_Chr4g0415311 [Rosa chinensis]
MQFLLFKSSSWPYKLQSSLPYRCTMNRYSSKLTAYSSSKLSQVMMKMLRSVCGHIVDEVRVMFRNYSIYSLTHVNRRANNVAHTLAHTALQSELSHSWLLYAPKFIRDAILSDTHR